MYTSDVHNGFQADDVVVDAKVIVAFARLQSASAGASAAALLLSSSVFCRAVVCYEIHRLRYGWTHCNVDRVGDVPAFPVKINETKPSTPRRGPIPDF